MGITLNNSGDGGSVNITLNYVISYFITKGTKYAVQGVPAKKAATVDTDTFVKNPSKYRIRARVTDAQKTTLNTLDEEPDSTCLLSDGILTNVNTRPQDIEFQAWTGHLDYPWLALIVMLAEDH